MGPAIGYERKIIGLVTAALIGTAVEEASQAKWNEGLRMPLTRSRECRHASRKTSTHSQ